VPQLTTSLTSSLGPVLGPLLGTLLGGEPASILTGALGTPSEGQLLGSLLGSASEPAKLIEELLSKLSPSTLQGILGSTLSGAPFSQTTVEGLATSLGTTAAALAGDLGKSTTELPATAMALTAPLTNGKLLSAIDGIGGLSLSVLNPSTPGGGGSGAGTGGSGGAGGAGGTSGGSGSGGSGGASGTGGGGGGAGQGSSGAGETNSQSSGTGGGLTTLVLNTPAAATVTPVAAARSTTSATGHVRMLSHQVKGGVATIIVQVPTAGKVTLAGKHVRSSSRLAARGELVTLKVTLAKATTASLHKRHQHLKVKLKATFKPLSGTSSSATVTVNFS
jgi:hypothetical protein